VARRSEHGIVHRGRGAVPAANHRDAPMNPIRLRSRAGMTLLELVVGIVVTGVVATIGAAAFSSIIDHRRIVADANAEVERGAALRDMLRVWIGSGTVATTTGGARGRTSGVQIRRIQSSTSVPAVTAAASTGDELTFTTSSLTPSFAPNTRVRLFVDGDANTAEIGLTIEYQGPNNAPLQRRQIDPNILFMTVEYLDQRTNRWYPFSEAATIRPIAARLYFPPPENPNDAPPVPALLQYPLLFVMGQMTAAQPGGR
jgi:prepilin-type N-terminal cleavage/methylation domain-containing protein